MFMCKTRCPYHLVQVQPMKSPDITEKIVDLDIKHQEAVLMGTHKICFGSEI